MRKNKTPPPHHNDSRTPVGADAGCSARAQVRGTGKRLQALEEAVAAQSK